MLDASPKLLDQSRHLSSWNSGFTSRPPQALGGSRRLNTAVPSSLEVQVQAPQRWAWWEAESPAETTPQFRADPDAPTPTAARHPECVRRAGPALPVRSPTGRGLGRLCCGYPAAPGAGRAERGAGDSAWPSRPPAPAGFVRTNPESSPPAWASGGEGAAETDRERGGGGVAGAPRAAPTGGGGPLPSTTLTWQPCPLPPLARRPWPSEARARARARSRRPSTRLPAARARAPELPWPPAASGGGGSGKGK